EKDTQKEPVKDRKPENKKAAGKDTQKKPVKKGKDTKKQNKNDSKNKTENNDPFKINEPFYVMNSIKKEPYYDKYGIDLNEYIINGMLNKEINNSTNGKIEEWDLYTPPCPNLHPVHYSDDVLNPVCEDIGIPLYDISNNYEGLPSIIRLHNITDQMKKWGDWLNKNSDNNLPNYRNATIDELVNDDYHPYDYGYLNLEKNEDENYYSEVIKSPMDQVPDPRRRRVFSMILFNSEFELLDLYLSEYYEIIDYFIIYESNSTFSGYKKPLYLTKTLLETNRYEKFRDKIIPVTLPVLQVEKYDQRGPGFPREHLARREIIEKGLRAAHARHGDIFIHGDLDEMPKARLLSYLKKCGGWEHLQMGIGGGPKSMDDPLSKNYFKDKKIPITKDKFGQFNVDYNLKLSIPFTVFFFEYSFHMIQNQEIIDFFHPNLAIFDARRALGQLPTFTNDGKNLNDQTSNEIRIHARNIRKEVYNDVKIFNKRNKSFDSSNFDPYLVQVGFWKSGWHLSSFLPNIKQFLNKIASYSHYNYYNDLTDKEIRKEILDRIRNNYYIFGERKKPMPTLNVKIPVTDEEKYPNIYSYKLWSQIKKEYKKNGKSPTFDKLNDIVLHEIPKQVMENPICYSYMLDRNFGLTKKLWWEVIPKKNWNTVDFKKIDKATLDQISPKVNKKNEVIYDV
ncbi:glycosyltransferase family 17 protein, partial [Piromyces sp. E2]